MIYNRPRANCNRQLSMQPVGNRPLSGARSALFLLLAINLFNYIDRQILAALEPDIRASFFAPGDVNAMTKTGLLADAFFVTYMIIGSILALDHRWFRCDFVELGQRRLRFGGDIRHSLCDPHLRGNWRRRLRPGGADHLGGSFPDRNTGSHDGDFLRGYSRWQRARLCNRRAGRCSFRLALGILSRYPSRLAAGPFVLLAARSARCCASPRAGIAAPEHKGLPSAFPHALLSY